MHLNQIFCSTSLFIQLFYGSWCLMVVTLDVNMWSRFGSYFPKK